MAAETPAGIDAISGFKKYTGEPNRTEDLEAFGLVRPGNHTDIRIATITIAGQQTDIRVSPSTFNGMTFLRPNKVDFRQAWRNLTGDTSLRPLTDRHRWVVSNPTQGIAADHGIVPNSGMTEEAFSSGPQTPIESLFMRAIVGIPFSK